MFDQGISGEGAILDMAADEGIIEKSGAWYSYKDDKLGQGRENVKRFLKENDDLSKEIEVALMQKLGIGASSEESKEKEEEAESKEKAAPRKK